MTNNFRVLLRTGLFVLSTTQILCASTNAQSTPIPSVLSSILSKREEACGHVDMLWRTNLRASYLGTDTSDTNIAAKQLAWAKSVSQEYKKRGFTDQKKIDKMVQSTVESLTEQSKSLSIDVAAIWQFNRDGQNTVVRGTVPSPPSLQPYSKFTQLYVGSSGLIIHNSNPPTVTQIGNPVAWISQGNSTHFRCPVPEGLSLSPEHFLALANFSPLGLYDGNWQLANTTKTSWILTSRVKPPDSGFVNYTITLSRLYQGAVVAIEAKPENNPSSQTWHITNFQKYESTWIGRTVNCISLAPGLGESHQSWELGSIRPSVPVDVQLSHQTKVQDFRLLGPNLTQNMLLRANEKNSSKIVYYNWNGKFPSIEELKALFQQQHPGESSPDPGKTSAANFTPFLGGILCLVGGVWMFKRRGQS